MGSVGAIERKADDQLLAPASIMPVGRYDVLELLTATSDADRREATTVDALATNLGCDTHTIEVHVDGLAACGLARRSADGGVRITITGEELLALGVDETVIVDPSPPSRQ